MLSALDITLSEDLLVSGNRCVTQLCHCLQNHATPSATMVAGYVVKQLQVWSGPSHDLAQSLVKLVTQVCVHECMCVSVCARVCARVCGYTSCLCVCVCVLCFCECFKEVPPSLSLSSLKVVEDLQGSLPTQFLQQIFCRASPVLQLRYSANTKVYIHHTLLVLYKPCHLCVCGVCVCVCVCVCACVRVCSC